MFFGFLSGNNPLSSIWRAPLGKNGKILVPIFAPKVTENGRFSGAKNGTLDIRIQKRRPLLFAKLSPKLCIRRLFLVFAISYAFHPWFLDFFGELWFVCCWYFLFDERKSETWSLTRITPLFSHCDLIVADNLMVNEMRSLTRVTPFSHTLSPLQLILLKRTILGKDFFSFFEPKKLPSCPCKAPHQKNEILNKSLGMSEKVSHEWVNIFYNLKTKSGLDIDSASNHHFQTWAEMCPNWGWNLNITIWW